MGKKIKVNKKGKKAPKNKPTSKKYSKYKIEGDKIIRAKNCLKCGPGIFMMETNDRLYCGKCSYTEFKSKKEQSEKAQEIPAN